MRLAGYQYVDAVTSCIAQLRAIKVSLCAGGGTATEKWEGCLPQHGSLYKKQRRLPHILLSFEAREGTDNYP